MTKHLTCAIVACNILVWICCCAFSLPVLRKSCDLIDNNDYCFGAVVLAILGFTWWCYRFLEKERTGC